MKTLRISNKTHWIIATISFFSLFSGAVSLFCWIIPQKMQLTWYFWKSGLFYSLSLFAIGISILIFFRLCQHNKTKIKQALRKGKRPKPLQKTN